MNTFSLASKSETEVTEQAFKPYVITDVDSCLNSGELLNSVSVSFQRQAMGKDKHQRKEGSGNRGRKEEVPPAVVTRSTAVQGEQRRLTQDDDATSRSSRHSSRRRTAAEGASGGEPVVEEDLDIPTRLMRVQQRLRRKEDPDTIAKDMPTHHVAWTSKNIRNHAQALRLKFKDIHYRACGVPPAADMNEPKARLASYDDVVITGTGGDVVTPKVAQVGMGWSSPP